MYELTLNKVQANATPLGETMDIGWSERGIYMIKRRLYSIHKYKVSTGPVRQSMWCMLSLYCTFNPGMRGLAWDSRGSGIQESSCRLLDGSVQHLSRPPKHNQIIDHCLNPTNIECERA